MVETIINQYQNTIITLCYFAFALGVAMGIAVIIYSKNPKKWDKRLEIFKEKVVNSLPMFMSIIKTLIGFSIVRTGGNSNSIVLVLGGTFLMIGGLNYIVPPIFDRIELYIMNKRDPDCGKIKFDASRGQHE